MFLTRYKMVVLTTLSGLVITLTGCGGGSSGSSDESASASSQGSVAMFVTDAPADPDLFDAVNVTLSQVALVPEDGGDPVVVRDGAPVTVDFLNLTHDALPLSYREGVPEGRYCSIELAVDNVELVLAEGDGTATPELPADGSVTLQPDECFEVVADGVVHVQLDLDLGKSIFVEDGVYGLRPVFFIDVIRAGLAPRLVRLEGTISEIDQAEQRVLLCDSLPIQRYDLDSVYQGCAWVDITTDTGLFDNLAHGGAPRPLSELYQDSKLGESATVTGVVDGFGHGVLELNIPAGQLPPPGECKLWHPERPAGQQPPPKPCSDLIATAPTDTVVIDHDARILLDRRGLVDIDALAVELGDFLTLDGSVETAVVDDRFTMLLRPGEAIDSADPLPVELQAAPVEGNGTRIVSKSGELLTQAAISEDSAISVDGIFVSSADVHIRSALVVIDELPALSRASGTVLTVSDQSAVVSTATAEDNPCAGAPGDLAVSFDNDTRFVTVTVTDAGSTSSMGGSLAADQTVDLYGTCAVDATFEADQIVIIEDTRSN